MKHMKQTLSSLLAITLLCCACSSTGANETSAGAATTSMMAAAPMAQQTSASGFADVESSAWYAEAASWCKEQGILLGDTFAPDTTMTRATVAEALYRVEGTPTVSDGASFSDIETGSIYADAAAWTSEKGVMYGYGGGVFGTNDPVTREQMAAILWRYAGSPAAGSSQNFADEDSIAGYAQEAVDWARANGVINGKDGNLFDPKGSLTRAQTAAILYRYLTGVNSNAPAPTPDSNMGDPVVYMTTNISADGLMAIYEALDWTPGSKVAVKLSTGEPGSNYLRTDLIGELIQSLDDPTIVECNTAYGGSRSNTVMHYQVAEDHGYTAIADVDIMDEDGSMSLPVVGGTNLTENYVGTHFANYDSFLILSHFKGHAMAGFGGAIKNISIGIASSRGKSHIHSGGTGGSMWSGDQDAFLESMAEAGKSVVEALDRKIVYINVMNRLSVDCDCDGNPAEPDMHDIGILASYDPVALDQACVDFVYAAADGGSLINRMESRNGIHTLEHAEEIGLGSRTYQLVNIDNQESGAASRQIKLMVANQECIVTLNDSPAASDLYKMLPLELTFEDYNQTEKISSLPERLSTEEMPDSFDPDVGDLCFYAPWGNLCIFYQDFRNSTSLIPLGRVDSGMETIAGMKDDFTVRLEAVR